MPGLQNSNRTNAMFAKIGIQPPVLKDSTNVRRNLKDRNERFDDASSFTGSEFQVLNPNFAAGATATSAQEKCESWLHNKPYGDSSLDPVTPPKKKVRIVDYPSSPSTTVISTMAADDKENVQSSPKKDSEKLFLSIDSSANLINVPQTKKTLGVPIRISSRLRKSVVNNKDANLKSVGVVPRKPTECKGPNSTEYNKAPEINDVSKGPSSKPNEANSCTSKTSLDKLSATTKTNNLSTQPAECLRDDCGEGDNSHSATENDESTTARRTLGYTKPLANKCFLKTASPTRTSEVTKQPAECLTGVRDEGESSHSGTDSETTPAWRTLGNTTIPLANEFSSSCKTTSEVPKQSACSDLNPSPGLPGKSIDCESSIGENKARKKLVFDYSAKNDEGNRRQHLQRKAVQLLKHDLSDNDSEESDSRWDFDGSDFDDPTWGNDGLSNKESSSSDSEDETGSSPKSSVPNSARSVNSSSSARPFINSPARNGNISPACSVNNTPASPPATKEPTKSALVKERRELRNKGCGYTTSTNKVVEAKHLRPLAKCKAKCSEKVTEDERKTIFAEYWNQADHDKRVAYIASHVFQMPKKVCTQSSGGSKRNRTCTLKYELEVRGVRIIFCKKCFLATLDENDGFVQRVMNNKKQSLSGVTSTDRRGRKPSVRKTPDATVDAINRHIHGFPKYSSHYGRSHTSRMYLGIGLSIQTMFDDYTAKGNPKTSRSTYSREFRKTGLKFKPPQIDTCQKCDTFAVALKSASSEDQKSEIVRERDEHHENSQLAYQTKKQDKADQTEESRVASFDLQQVLACPQMTAGTVFYKRQLNVYNLTIFDCFKKQGINHMWTEIEAGRGANEISSCLTHYISSGIPPCVKKLTLWSDTCSGQNKNSIVCAALITGVAAHPSLEIIDQKFLVAGHTHMECDQVHAQIEKKKRRTSAELHHPSNFYNFVRSVEYRKETMDVVEMKDKFLDFAAMLQLKSGGPLIHRQKNRDGDPFCFTNVQWFRYQRQNPTTIQYKESLNEDVPFKEVSFRRRGKLGSKALKPQPCSSEEIPISVEKKKDLIELLPLVNPVYHDFYRNIRSSADQIDVDPDCVPPQDVSEEIHSTLLDEN